MPGPIPRLRGIALRACAASLLLMASGGFRKAPATGLRPSVLVVCETNTATLCARWRRTGDGYVADWEQGSHAEIRVTRFDGRRIVLVRKDPSGTSAGMQAVYEGTPRGRTVREGIVTWTYGGRTFSGTWMAEW